MTNTPLTSNKIRIKAALNAASQGHFFDFAQKVQLQNLALLMLEWPEDDQRVTFIQYHLDSFKNIRDISSQADQDKAITHITKAYLGLECVKHFDQSILDTNATAEELSEHVGDFSNALKDIAAYRTNTPHHQNVEDALWGAKNLATDCAAMAVKKYETLPHYVHKVLKDASCS
jgi:hypothetical protein